MVRNEQRQWLLRAIGKLSRVIQPKNMVRMTVRNKDAVQRCDVRTQALLAKIGASIDNQPPPRMLHHNAGTQPVIPRVLRSADFAVAADRRDAE